MIPLAIIMAFLTTIITLFFNSLSDAWKDLTTETKDVYATSIQNFVEEVKKDFADKPTKRRMKEPDDFKGNPDKVAYLHLTALSKELRLLLLYPCHSFSNAHAPNCSSTR